MKGKNNLERAATVVGQVFPRGAFTYTVIFISIFFAYVMEDPLINEALGEYFTPHSQTLISAFNTGILVTMIYFMIVSISAVFAKRHHEYHNPEIAHGSYSVLKKKPLTADRINRVACHEAGHLLGIAFFDAEPNKLTAKIHSYHGPTLGNVSYEYDDDFLCTRNSQIAVMKVALCGALAEELVFGDCFVGSQTDNRNWELQAKNLMAAFIDENHWFHAASNEYEAAINSTTLVTLKEDMSQSVREMLKNNKNVLHEAAEFLKENPESEGEELYKFVKKVVLA